MKSPSNLESHNREIRSIFSRISRKYDTMNRIISLGQANSWRDAAIKELGMTQNDWIIDLATGSGDLAIRIKDLYPKCFIVGIDITPQMLLIARLRNKEKNIYWIVADAHHLPFRDRQFDKVISAYLLRNAADLPACLVEQNRILKPMGRMVALDTVPPGKSLFSPLVKIYLKYVLPMLGFVLANDYKAYKYLSTSTEQFKDAKELAYQLKEAKFHKINVIHRMLSTIIILSTEKFILKGM